MKLINKTGNIIEKATNSAKTINDMIKGQDKDIQMAIFELWKDELKQDSIFIKGWRPMIGWCLAYLIALICVSLTVDIVKSGFKVDFDLHDTIAIIAAILTGGSIAISRTVEKIKKANKNH